MLAAAQGIVVPLGRPRVIEQPRAPIESAGPRWAVACDGAKDPDSWTKPAPPVRIHGNTYLVGTSGISSILIVGDQGDILIDGGPENAANLIADNIRALGYRVQDIRIILTSHEHFDHVGGIAKLQQLSGATVMTSAPAAKVLSSGIPATDDPQFGAVKPFPPVQVGRVIRDGEEGAIAGCRDLLDLFHHGRHRAVKLDGGFRLEIYGRSVQRKLLERSAWSLLNAYIPVTWWYVQLLGTYE